MATVFEATVTATFDDVAGGNYQRLFDFSNGAGIDSIWLGNVATSNTLAFEVEQNGTRFRLEVPGAIDEGVETTWNVTIDDTGTLTIFKNGIQIGSQNFGVAAVPNDVPRTENLIGDSLHVPDDPLVGNVRSIDVETTLTNGFDIVITDTFNTVGAFDGTDRAEVLDATDSTGADSLSGDGGDDSIYGGGGDDTLSGGAGNDALFGGAGNDSLAAGDGNDTVDGGSGDDNISAFQGDDSISGGDGADTIFSLGGGNDTIDGGADADTIIIRTISDATVTGGETTTTGTDTDRLNVAEGTTALTLDFSGAEAGTIGDGVSTVTFTGIEEVFLGDGNDTINIGAQTDGLTVDGGGGDDVFDALASSGANTFQGQAGDDTILGGSGSDTLGGGSGRDVIHGGDGADSINAGGDADTIYGGSGNDTIDGAQDDDLIDGGSGADVILGGDGSDTILGGAGADNIQGGGDADTFVLTDGFGNDTISGGETVTTGTDSDVIDASALTGAGVSVNVANEAGTLGDGTNTVTFAGIERFILTDQDDTFIAFGNPDISVDAGAGDDLIREGNGGNTIDAGTGNDTIIAGLGISTITGGEDVGGDDTDTLDFRTANDPVTIIFDGAESGSYADNDGDSGTFSQIELFQLTSGNDMVDASLDTAGVIIHGGGGSDTIVGGFGDDLITGSGPVSGDPGDSLAGGAGDDIILGDAGDDTIEGGTGNDFIAGGADNDLLTGGAGNDYFAYFSGDGLDTITDFNAGNSGLLNDGDSTNNDFIDLSAYYDHISELYADQVDDGILNQSNTTDSRGRAVDYSDNTRFDTNGTAGDEGIVFTGATGDASFFTVENTGVICFAAGTLILTPRGEVPIETLIVGQLLVTRDNGPQPLVWIGTRRVTALELDANPKLGPVRIDPQVSGGHTPLILSPQHGLLVNMERNETLVRAAHLARLPGGKARAMRGCRGITYFHLMLEAHQIIFACGAPTESFYPGSNAYGALSAAARREIQTLFPALDPSYVQRSYGPLVRDCVPYRKLPDHLSALSPAI